VTLYDSGTPQEPARVTDWLRPRRIFAGTTRAVGVLVLLTIVAYHLAWWFSGRRYLSADLLVLAGAVALVVVLALLTRVKGGLVTVRGALYYFLALAGAAAGVLGVSMIGRAPQASPSGSGVVGTLVLIGGVFTFAAGMFLRPARTGLSRQVPHDFATQQIKIAESDGLVRRSRSDFGAGRIERLVELCKGHIKTDDLHYVAYYVDGKCAFYLDVFDSHQLEAYFTEVTPDRRREEYLRLSVHLDGWLRDLNRSFEDIDSGVLIRLVLDVERGALYYYKVDGRRFLVGVTLDQSVVHKADSAMTKLTREAQVLLGHRNNPDFND
jgi:hypothetical protein